MREMLKSFGAEVEELSPGVISVTAKEIKTTVGDSELVSEMRASTMVMGPLLARCGKCVMPMPADAPSENVRLIST